MDFLQQSFQVQFSYPVYLTEHLFSPSNPVFRRFLEGQQTGVPKKLLFLVDDAVINYHPALTKGIEQYIASMDGYSLSHIMIVPGGEICKNDNQYFYKIVDAVNVFGIDRHSYIVGIGGGSLLDLAGYAAAVSHRGIRHIRIPTTVLAQNDSGVGVKNGINYKGKKNFLGTFAPPAAVFNDSFFLTTLSDREWRSGIAEAIKVALIKDAAFFEWLEVNAASLVNRDMAAMKYLVKHCAALHMEHIRSGDPFELGSSRPLDFGHWSAHKLEQLTGFEIRHGEAVALGIALDSVYSFLSGRITQTDAERIVDLLQKLGFATTHPLMAIENDGSSILTGLNEFREHLGGRLTIMLLSAIGRGEEVHQLDQEILKNATEWLHSKSIIPEKP
jgi:3-dehydroquinate synthase